MTEEKKRRITAIVQSLKQMDIVSLKLMENNSELLSARDAMEVEPGKLDNRKEMKQSENLTGPFAAEREKRVFRHSSN